MAYRDDGGEFSDDPITKLLAMKMGSMGNEELAKQEGIPQQAIDMSSGVMGTVGSAKKFQGLSKALGQEVPQAAENVAQQTAAYIPLKDKIAQAVANSPVKQMTGDVKSTLGSVKFAPEANPNFGKVIKEVAPQAEAALEPLIPDERRMRLLQMIKEDKKLLGK